MRFNRDLHITTVADEGTLSGVGVGTLGMPRAKRQGFVGCCLWFSGTVQALCQASGEASPGKFALILIVQIVWIRLYCRSDIVEPWRYIYTQCYTTPRSRISVTTKPHLDFVLLC